MTSMRQRSRPGLGWAYGQALGQTGALNLLFLVLFLVAQPLALLIIGRANYIRLTVGYDTFYDSYTFRHLNPVLLPLHIILTLLALTAVILLTSIQQRTLYLKSAVDREQSMPLTLNQRFAGRSLALLTSFLLIFLVNGGLTGLILASWGQGSHFINYLPVYGQLFLACLQLLAFSLVIFSISGTLFDAILTNTGIQMAWVSSVFLILAITERRIDPPSDLLWFLTPVAGLFTGMAWPQSPWQSLVMILFWTSLAWFFYRGRPAEYAGMRNGRLVWHRAIQPLYVLLGASSLGAFVHSLFDWQKAIFRSPAFYLGALAGACLGQLASSAISGAPIKKKSLGLDLISVLAGLLLMALMIWLVSMGIKPAP